MLEFYANFEINDETGDPLTDHDMTQIHYSRITSLQVRLNKNAVICMLIIFFLLNNFRKLLLQNFRICVTLPCLTLQL
jgi:Intron-binding protein aquarius N-terminus